MPSVASQQEYIIRSSKLAFENPEIPVAEYFAAQLAKYDPDEVALIDANSNGEFTFGEINRQFQHFACGLLHLGLAKDDLVLFFADNSPQYAFAMFGAMYLGVTTSPVTPANGSFELAEQIVDTKGSVLVFGVKKLPVVLQFLNNPKYSAAISMLKTLIALDCEEIDPKLLNHPAVSSKQVLSYDQVLAYGDGKLLNSIPHFKPASLSKDHFIIIYTSGTTGKPKGAIHSNRSFLAWIMNTKTECVDLPGKRILLNNPMGHISGACFVTMALAWGMSVVLFYGSDLEAMLHSVERFKVNYFYISPAHAAPLAKVDYHKRYDLRSLEMIKYGGCKVAENLLETIKAKYAVKLFDYYGSTEFFGHVGQCESSLWDEFEPGNLGTLQPNVQMKIVDLSSGEPLGPGVQGEICFRGAPCFIGYLNNEEVTASTIDAEGWYHSGDVGYYNEAGCLFIKDRIKELIKYKMWSVIPGEIEDFLYRHEAVAACCVVGVPHITDGNLVRAYVQLVDGSSVSEQELIDYVKENIGFQKRLRGGVRFLGQFPRTVLGKVDRQYFKRLVKDELLTEQVP